VTLKLRYGLRMAEHVRTAIRRLFISGFRSVRLVDLPDLPDVVVLHGPNGSGKSSLLLAAQLVVRAAARPGALPVGREHAVALSLADADEWLGLRPNDFHFGVSPVIRVGLDVALGTRAAEILRSPPERSMGQLRLELVVQLPTDDELQYWFERADLDGVPLGEADASPATQALQKQLGAAHERVEKQRAVVDGQERAVAALERKTGEKRPTSADIEAERAQAVVHARGQNERLRSLESEVRRLEAQLDDVALPPERVRRALLPRLIQVSPAYRVPGHEGDPEAALYNASLSSDRLQRDAMRRLGKRLAHAGLFGAGAGPVTLVPINEPRYGERQMLLGHPTHGELPLRNLGSGEQQVIYMLAQRVITPFPIAHIEEPEAHLHTSLMEPFARVLHESVIGDGGTPDIDQLWIATHHHHFAIAHEYLDVALEGGDTKVRQQLRAKAGLHFFEPGPIWEALRQLATSARTREAVVFRDAAGAPVTAGQILESIEADPEQRVAKAYAREMTEMMVLAMRRRAEAVT
jgi:hypothetical protein